FSQSGNIVTFNNQTNTGQYRWDFGDGSNSFDNSPTHTYATPGSYNVCLLATNACGADTLCRTVNVSTGSLQLNIGQRNGMNGETVLLPITLSGATNLATLAGSFTITPASMVQVLGVSPGLINPQFNPANLSFSYFASNGAGQALTAANDNILFYLRLQVLANSGHADVAFANSPVAVELTRVVNGLPTVAVPNLGAGRVNASPTSGVGFEVVTQFWNNGEDLSEILYRFSELGSSETQTVLADTTGYANLGLMPLGNRYQLSAEKTDDPARGLSTFGLYVGQRYLLGLPAPQIISPYQLIAADVNCSNSFSTIDLYLIQRLILGEISNFGSCSPWAFVHQSSNLPTTGWNATNVFHTSLPRS
ncbi:MAG: PKD domain-containing protein, partial [Lewinella sp.]|nr:PKD domain-containing protein [Lewinella sp.]